MTQETDGLHKGRTQSDNPGKEASSDGKALIRSEPGEAEDGNKHSARESAAGKEPATSNADSVERCGDSEDRPKLAPEDIVERLRLNSPGLAKEVYAIAESQAREETIRHKSLSDKASALLGFVGVTVGLTFTFAVPSLGVLGLSGTLLFVFSGILTVSLIMGSLSALLAVRALWISKEHRAVSEQDVFSTYLQQCDQEPNDDVGAAMYQRFMTSHFWRIREHELCVNERLADSVRRAQRAYAAFLTMILVLGAFIAFRMILLPS